MATMMKRFKISKLICFTISDYNRHLQSLNRTPHHVDSPLFRLFSSSSYNNRSNDGGRPPPRRRSGSTSDRTPSSSRLSGFIDGNDDRAAGDNRGREREGGRRNFDTNRKPNYQNHDEYRPSNRASSELNKSDHRKSESNRSYVPFDDDEQKPPISPSRRVKDDKIQDVDGFLDRFKLGFDQEEENKPNSDKLASGEEAPPPPPSPPTPPEDADEIFRKMKETGLIPNAVAMLHGLCSDGLVQEAMKLFALMRERGSIPDVVVYTAVVEGFCKSQKPDEAMRIFKKMQNNGIVPNAFSYGVLVQGLCRGKRLDDALEFCVEMVEAGHSPNLATFTGLVNGFCRERGLEAAEIMIRNLKDKGFGFDEKALRDFMEKKGPFLPLVWEAIFGKKGSKML
ncbi:hypothetical protein L6452_24604 [Arctium lappa]|uniref:Uncharacterized protein n=1 Tax=Arctium lappa TaxID=4217 RepID=A0ACB9A907_ARCLA|nr:hypothetical protein L6452_24604 [Arctium lappa]